MSTAHCITKKCKRRQSLFKYPFNLLPLLSKLPSNSNLNTDSDLTTFKLKSIKYSLKSLVKTIRLSVILGLSSNSIVVSALLLTTMISLNITPANGALSAKTANTIQGAAPALSFNGGTNVATNLNELVGFTMPNIIAGGLDIQIDGSYSGGAINTDPNWTFNQFVTRVTANGSPNTISSSYYYDADGDTPHATTPVAGTLKATCSYDVPDGNGGITTKTLSTADLATKFDACNAPYKLTIEASGVVAQSAYGDPSVNTYGSLTKSYTINVADYKFCYARPNQMVAKPNETWVGWNGSSWVWNSGSSSATASGGNGGRYSADFDLLNGFKADASTKFPTTGFPKAKFQLVMTGLQTDWNYSVPSHSSGEVTVDANGHVTLNSKPSGNVTVRATLITQPSIHFDYTFNPTTVWAVPKGSSTYIYAQATGSSGCGSALNLLTRAELTNSPRNTVLAGWSYVVNYYTRAIGEGLFLEWGWTDSISYPDSQWVTSSYWTQDVSTGSRQFAIGSYDGRVGYTSTSTRINVACRK